MKLSLLIAGAAVAGMISGCGDKLPLENSNSLDASKNRISVTGGNSLTGYFGNFVTGVPQVTVTDKNGTALDSVTVTFTAQGGGKLTRATVITDSAGRASPTSWRLGPSGTQSVTASAPDALPVTITAAASNLPGKGFHIEVRYADGTTPTAAQREAFDNAAFRWSQIILQGGSPYPIHEFADGCGDLRGQTVDGVVIIANLQPIDGAGKILGAAGPCILRDENYLPAQGTMQFDTDDLAMLESSGRLQDVILHEMGHVLGFGTIWEIQGGAGFPTNSFLIREPPENPVFNGLASRFALFGLAGVNGFLGTPVPVENTGGEGTRYAHWRESTFGSELMTGWLNTSGSNPLSALTIAQFRDLGYLVNDALGEPFGFATQLRAAGQEPVQIVEGKLSGPMVVINKTGHAVRRVERIYK